MSKIEGYKTYIVFGLILLSEIVSKVFGWSVSMAELPPDLAEWAMSIVALVGLVLRTVTKTKSPLL